MMKLKSADGFLQISWFEFTFIYTTFDCWIICTCFLGHGYGLKVEKTTWMRNASLCVCVRLKMWRLTWHMITSKTHYISFNSILFGSVLFHSIRLYVCLEQVCKYMRSFAICIILLLNAIPLEHVNERYMTLSIKITKSHIVLFFYQVELSKRII